VEAGQDLCDSFFTSLQGVEDWLRKARAQSIYRLLRRTGDGRHGSRLCENVRDWRPDCVRDDAGEDLMDRRGEISRIEPYKP
jgi:hypothetical protein